MRMPWRLLAALVIAWATLTPQLGPPTRPFVWCLGCGPTWLSDLIANIALFVPLGAALVYSRLPLSRALLIGVAASVAIEAMQRLGVASGRTPALADVIANTIGTAVGAWTMGSARRITGQLLTATAGLSRVLLATWTIAVSLMLAATAWAVAPVERAPSADASDASSEAVKPSWMPIVPGGPFVQSVLRGTVNGVQLSPRSAGQIIASAAPTDSLRITLLRQVINEKDRRDRPITLVYVHGPKTVTERASLLQFADDLILQGEVNASRIGLQTPALRVRGVFALDSVLIWQYTRITAVVAPGRLSLEAQTPDARIGTVPGELALNPALGWTLIQPIVGATARIAPLLTALWLVIWFLPGGLWLGQAIGSRRGGGPRSLPTRAIASVLWSAVPLGVAQLSVAVVGVAPVALWQIVCGVGGAIVGAIVGSRVSAGVGTRTWVPSVPKANK